MLRTREDVRGPSEREVEHHLDQSERRLPDGFPHAEVGVTRHAVRLVRHVRLYAGGVKRGKRLVQQRGHVRLWL